MDAPLRPLSPAIALALVLASPAGAGDETTEASWLQLDAELEVPDEDLNQVPSSVRFGALVRTFFGYSDDDIATGGGRDLSGFSLNDIDLFFELDVSRTFMARVSGDISTGDWVLEDAYGKWYVIPDYVAIRVGQFKPHILRSSSLDPERLVFKERTLLGALFDEWDEGVEVNWGWEPWEFWASVTNGPTGQEAHHRYAFRAAWDFYDPWPEPYEGGHGAPIYLRWKVALAWFTESSVPENSGLGGDVSLSLGPYSLYFEYMHLDDGAGGPVNGTRFSSLDFAGDSDPVSLTVGLHFTEKWQANLRAQNTDNDLDTKAFGASLNYYPNDSWYNWVLDATSFDSDGDDGVILQVGLVVGGSR